jgi:hypothetical protein
VHGPDFRRDAGGAEGIGDPFLRGRAPAQARAAIDEDLEGIGLRRRGQRLTASPR